MPSYVSSTNMPYAAEFCMTHVCAVVAASFVDFAFAADTPRTEMFNIIWADMLLLFVGACTRQASGRLFADQDIYGRMLSV